MTKRKPKSQPPPAADTTQITIGPAALALALVLALALIGLGWWRLRGPGAEARAPASAPVDGSAAGSTASGATAPTAASAPGTASAPSTGVTAEGDPFIGAAGAPVTIVAYSDYRCPNCRQFATEVLPWLKQTWLAQGFVKVVFRDFPIRGDASLAAAHAAHCAGEQGRYWDFHDRLFADLFSVDLAKPELARASLRQAAAELGLDLEAFAACTDAGRFRQRIAASDKSARDQGFEGTPTYLVNGRKTQGAIPIADWERLFRIYQQELGVGAPAGVPTVAPTGGAGAP